MVMTVTGEIASDQLGQTLAHEHLYCDISCYSGRPDNRVMNVALMVDELAEFRKAGGRSIIELTPEGIGRDAVRLREISEGSGVQIVSGMAFYDESTYPEWLRTASVDQIADYLVRQIEVGTDGVRAGLIGELASHNEPAPNASGYQLREAENRVFVAAAKAQKKTGVAISTHASLGRAGHAQLNVLERAGADLRRVVIGHCDAHWHEDIELDLKYYLPILERGAYCQFDLIGWTELASDDVRAERIAALVKLGYASKVTLSTDTCRLSHLRRNGGRGLNYLWKSFLPRLREKGVNEPQIHSMLVEAPRTVLTGV
jgi:predicted metal-dependent phosphotriesterase family hydrolase